MAVKEKTKQDKVADIVKELELRHIAIIMDGNRRWAKKNFFPSAIGHQRGVTALKNAIKACHVFGVEYLTVYAFSTENWNRKPDEVEFLMKLLAQTVDTELEELSRNNVRIKFLGNIAGLNKNLRNILINAERSTAHNDGVKLQIAFNYGARAEMAHTIKKLAAMVKNGEIEIEDINENMISDNLYTAGIPDPDLLIRTGSEQRISNYLLWQIAYSEILVMDEFWPEFDESVMEKAILEFKHRNRRYGQ